MLVSNLSLCNYSDSILTAGLSLLGFNVICKQISSFKTKLMHALFLQLQDMTQVKWDKDLSIGREVLLQFK